MNRYSDRFHSTVWSAVLFKNSAKLMKRKANSTKDNDNIFLRIHKMKNIHRNNTRLIVRSEKDIVTNGKSGKSSFRPYA